jgi:hypothetical protein
MAFPAESYRGPNPSHVTFHDRHGYLNALYYLVVSCRGALEAKLQNDLEKPGIAIGVVTNAISKTQFQGVFVHTADAKLMANDFGRFLLTFQQQTIAGAYRVLMTFLSEFLLEARDARLVQISEDDERRLRQRFVSSKQLGTLYEEIGVPITSTADELVNLKALVAARNVIEHNDALVNAEYLRLTGHKGLRIGDAAPTGSKEVGEALAISEWLAASVNRRGLSLWPALVP